MSKEDLNKEKDGFSRRDSFGAGTPPVQDGELIQASALENEMLF